jgi:hypothetical protein
MDIEDESTNPVIKESFRRAAADEQNQAVWFLYYFVKAKKTIYIPFLHYHYPSCNFFPHSLFIPINNVI